MVLEANIYFFLHIYVQDGQEVEMTRPVSTLHKVEQKQAGGEEMT